MIRLRSWEYWPFGIIQFPAFLYWMILSIRERSLTFFTAANPGIEMGGMFGESKYQVMKLIPDKYLPVTFFFRQGTPAENVVERMRKAELILPVVLKPDIGERGYRVQRIHHLSELQRYLEHAQADFLLQECVQLPLEFGVFYVRRPWEISGRVTSVVGKEMLTVTGDGRSDLRALIIRNDRAKLQWEKLSVAFADQLGDVIPEGKKLELVSIGNHCLGTRFINANHLINDQLNETFDAISQKIPGFYFGRFDLKCASLQDFYAGNIKILELNGCGAEPGHIYDEGFSFWEALKVPVVYLHYIHQIARANRRSGVRYVGFWKAISYYRKFKAVVK